MAVLLSPIWTSPPHIFPSAVHPCVLCYGLPTPNTTTSESSSLLGCCSSWVLTPPLRVYSPLPAHCLWSCFQIQFFDPDTFRMMALFVFSPWLPISYAVFWDIFLKLFQGQEVLPHRKWKFRCNVITFSEIYCLCFYDHFCYCVVYFLWKRWSRIILYLCYKRVLIGLPWCYMCITLFTASFD